MSDTVTLEKDERIGRIMFNRPDVLNTINGDLPIALAARISTVPLNQLTIQKIVINQPIESIGLANTQRLGTLFDGITRHSPEGMNFKKRSKQNGWKETVRERGLGTFDWTANRPITPEK